MPSVCFYFQVHQPQRIKRCSFFNVTCDPQYFDDEHNKRVMQKVAQKCYLPANRALLKLIRRLDGAFRCAFSITGVAVDQMRRFAPEVLESFIELAETGCVEFLAETYYHSLAALYDHKEFKEQVDLHIQLMEELFHQRPQVFRNTELIYADFVGHLAAEMGFRAVLAEGAQDVLGWRSPNFVYSVPEAPIRLLLKNYRLSDDVAFRFSDRRWEEWPLTADKYAHWIHSVSGCGDVVNLFMDYETFGEHQWESTGIFEFLDYLPEAVLLHPDWSILTPSQVVEKYPVVAELPFHRLTSWADIERDLTAWRGNRMQNSALEQVYQLGRDLKSCSAGEDRGIMDAWRKLLTSDHFYYMCTKWFSDGDVHAYFSPYESPYEAFVNYMNVLKDARQRWLGNTRPETHEQRV